MANIVKKEIKWLQGRDESLTERPENTPEFKMCCVKNKIKNRKKTNQNSQLRTTVVYFNHNTLVIGSVGYVEYVR